MSTVIHPDLFRVAVLKSALRLHIKGGGKMRVNRHLTPTRLLQLATEYTGIAYRRGQHAQALADLETMTMLVEPQAV